MMATSARDSGTFTYRSVVLGAARTQTRHAWSKKELKTKTFTLQLHRRSQRWQPKGTNRATAALKKQLLKSVPRRAHAKGYLPAASQAQAPLTSAAVDELTITATEQEAGTPEASPLSSPARQSAPVSTPRTRDLETANSAPAPKKQRLDIIVYQAPAFAPSTAMTAPAPAIATAVSKHLPRPPVSKALSAPKPVVSAAPKLPVRNRSVRTDHTCRMLSVLAMLLHTEKVMTAQLAARQAAELRASHQVLEHVQASKVEQEHELASYRRQLDKAKVQRVELLHAHQQLDSARADVERLHKQMAALESEKAKLNSKVKTLEADAYVANLAPVKTVVQTQLAPAETDMSGVDAPSTPQRSARAPRLRTGGASPVSRPAAPVPAAVPAALITRSVGSPTCCARASQAWAWYLATNSAHQSLRALEMPVLPSLLERPAWRPPGAVPRY